MKNDTPKPGDTLQAVQQWVERSFRTGYERQTRTAIIPVTVVLVRRNGTYVVRNEKDGTHEVLPDGLLAPGDFSGVAFVRRPPDFHRGD